MTRFVFRSLIVSTLYLLAITKIASSQTLATDLPAALVGKTIVPGIQISYAGDTSTRKFENNQPSATPIKTYVYQDGHEKFFVEDGIMKGFLHVDAEYPRFFDAGTAFKISNVILEKKDIELILSPTPEGSDLGDVKLMLDASYNTRSAQELGEIINRMVRAGQVSGLAEKKPKSTSPPVTLDCTSKDAYIDRTLSEVILDEASQTATFETVGTHRAMQPAVFTDAEIKWSNGIPGDARLFYTLSRSSGILVTNRSGTNLYTVHFDCAVRTKKF